MVATTVKLSFRLHADAIRDPASQWRGLVQESRASSLSGFPRNMLILLKRAFSGKDKISLLFNWLYFLNIHTPTGC